MIGSIISTSYIILNHKSANNKIGDQGTDEPEIDDQKPCYVGTTYGGNSVQEAKEFIDKVKDYTSLFILLSTPLQYNTESREEIGDYAIASGLNYAFGIDGFTALGLMNVKDWVNDAKQRWGNSFAGVYVYDEPGGKFAEQYPGQQNKDPWISKNSTGHINVWENHIDTYYPARVTTYCPNGTIEVTTKEDNREKNGTLMIYSNSNILIEQIENVPWQESSKDEYYPNGTYAHFVPPEPITTVITYQPNGDITVWKKQINTFYTVTNGSEQIAQVEHYNAVLDRNPLGTYDKVAQVFETDTARYLQNIEKNSATTFTSDFMLYWWDYKSGYDVVFAELGWNNSITQEIGLVRGAANLQGKSWGTIITWKYTQAPFLTDGEEMYQQMKNAYRAGAEYIIIFNYSEDPQNPNTLQEEHFQALENFWNNIIQSSNAPHGGVKANAVLVLPQNYGWGMRNPDDHIWGIWQADETSQQIWTQLQSKIDKHGLKLDIVFEDPNYPVTDRYTNIYYWDQK